MYLYRRTISKCHAPAISNVLYSRLSKSCYNNFFIKVTRYSSRALQVIGLELLCLLGLLAGCIYWCQSCRRFEWKNAPPALRTNEFAHLQSDDERSAICVCLSRPFLLYIRWGLDPFTLFISKRRIFQNLCWLICCIFLVIRGGNRMWACDKWSWFVHWKTIPYKIVIFLPMGKNRAPMVCPT